MTNSHLQSVYTAVVQYLMFFFRQRQVNGLAEQSHAKTKEPQNLQQIMWSRWTQRVEKVAMTGTSTFTVKLVKHTAGRYEGDSVQLNGYQL